MPRVRFGEVHIFNTYFHALDDNFRTDYLLNAQLGKYVGKSVRIFKCPGVKSTYSGRSRVRSISMNGYLGDPSEGAKTAGYRSYRKLSDLTVPAPSSTFVFIGEREDNINDGFFYVAGFENAAQAVIGDYPASYHNSGGGLSFADGHSEIRKWVDARTRPPLTKQPLQWGVPSANNQDMWWLTQRSTAKQ